MDLIPPALVAARCFPAEQADVEEAAGGREAAAGALDAFLEEHAAADGALADADADADAANDKGKVTRGAVQVRWSRIFGQSVNPDYS